jgi:hypothetical protein
MRCDTNGVAPTMPPDTSWTLSTRLAIVLAIIAQSSVVFAQAPVTPVAYDDETLSLVQPDPAEQEWSSLLERVELTELRLDAIDDAAAEKKKKDAYEKCVESKKKTPWYEKISIRGYSQFRYNWLASIDEGSARPQHAHDGSIGDNDEFLLRRARVILYGDISDHCYIYIQPDFASTPNGSTDAIHFTQLRDWYADLYVDKEKVHRFRVGQSKVPYGWENLQSSSNRLTLDRNDAFNSATRNERDLGVFYYWTPEYAQEIYQYVSDKNLKGSGNYGVFGFGVHNGQGGSLAELNDELHMNARLNIPMRLENGQIIELGIQGFTGRYVVLGSAIRPLGVGPAVIPQGTATTGAPEGILDERIGWTFIAYPQPIGFQCEWTVGRGAALSDDQTSIEARALYGGYVLVNAKYETEKCGIFFPFARYQQYNGGYRSFRNAPYNISREWNIGIEWQIRKEVEWVWEYAITDRTNLSALSNGESYRQFEGSVIRTQLQVNY